MAIYHFNVKIKNKQNIIKSSAYNSGSKIRDKLENKSYNYKKKEEVLFSGIFLPKGCHERFRERVVLWNEVKSRCIRKDSQVAKSIIVALPKELGFFENFSLLNKFCEDVFVSKGHIVDLNIHFDESGDNPHAHILVTTAKIDLNGNLGERDYSIDSKQSLLEWRELWEKTVNLYLKEYAPQVALISSKSKREHEIEQFPQKHTGYRVKQG